MIIHGSLILPTNGGHGIKWVNSQSQVTHDKTNTNQQKLRKQHTPEFRQEALKLAERIGIAAAARELSLYESQLYAWRSKLKNAHSASEREQEMSVEIARL